MYDFMYCKCTVEILKMYGGDIEMYGGDIENVRWRY